MNLDITNSVKKFLAELPPKQFKQVSMRMLELNRIPPPPHDSRHLSGHPGCFRIDSGEYRICYQINAPNNVVEVITVGPRNDGEVYKKLERKKR